ncbi:hypothetical protein [Clostridium estertheticum]|nr:hypothetical protein [Clostridium estertheticum]
MVNSNQYAWTCLVKKKCLDEYVEIRLDLWQEVLDILYFNIIKY